MRVSTVLQVAIQLSRIQESHGRPGVGWLGLGRRSEGLSIKPIIGGIGDCVLYS